VDLRDYLQALRSRWRLVAAAVVIVVAAATAISLLQTPIYAAHVKLFVSATEASGGDGSSNAYQLGLLSQQRVTSYADLVSGPKVAARVVDELALGIPPAAVQSKISAHAPLNTVIIKVAVHDISAQRAQAIANSVGKQFAALVDEIERPDARSPALVKVSVVEPAELPAGPVSPRKKLNVALGLIVGLGLGVGSAVLRETLDTTVKTQDDLAAVVVAPTLGRIAYDSNAPRRPLIIQDDPHSQRAEAFRQLRTNLQFVDIDKAPKSIVVTSSVPSEGKSTSCANLAISLAQAGLKVILVEADLRRPQISDYMGIESSVGLTSVLIGRVDLADAIQPWGGDGRLFVLPCGPIPPNPAELLGSQGMADLLKRLESSSDIVLIDTPPLLPVTDAAVLAALADGAILIVRSGQTRREQVKAASAALSAVGARVLGVVLTMVTSRASDPNSYAYSYEYRYGSRPTSGAGRDVLPEGSRRPRPAATGGTPLTGTQRQPQPTTGATAPAGKPLSSQEAPFYVPPAAGEDARRP
jgi:capsular exopolysaccharide synthesis family protein